MTEMGDRQGDRNEEDSLVAALGESDTQHVLPNQGGVGKHQTVV